MHFAPTLYDYLTKELGKPMVLVLNKIDLAPPPLVVAWKHYFAEKFPELRIVLFTSFPRDKNELDSLKAPGSGMQKTIYSGYLL